MKKTFAILGAALSLSLFACSSSSSGPSLAEKCEKGVTENCLEGATWNMNAFYNSEDGVTFTVYHALSSPTSIVFNEDKTFNLTYSSDVAINSDNACLGGEENGNWSLNGSSLTMNFTFGCLLGSNGTTVSLTPAVLTLDGQTSLNIGVNKIHTTGVPGYEIFTGVEK